VVASQSGLGWQKYRTLSSSTACGLLHSSRHAHTIDLFDEVWNDFVEIATALQHS
jgi:hypothetical protein